jgi:hypothetical protein
MRAQQAMTMVRMNQVLVLGFEDAAAASSDVMSERAENASRLPSIGPATPMPHD